MNEDNHLITKDEVDKVIVMSYEDAYMVKELDMLRKEYGIVSNKDINDLIKENPSRPRRRSIYASSELIRVRVKRYLKYADVIRISRLYSPGRAIVLECTNDVYNEFHATYKDKFIFLEYLQSYESKSRWCDNYLKRLGLKLDSRATKSSLIFFMITNTDKWIELETLKDILDEDVKITLEDLTNYLPNYEFYRISDWCQEVVKGTTKTTPIKRLDYFINSRGYSYRTMLNKLKNYIEFLLVLKQLHLDGYIYGYVSDEDLQKRLNGMNKNSKVFDYNESISKGINIVRVLSKDELLRMYKICIGVSGYNKSELVGVLEEIRVGKGESDKVKFDKSLRRRKKYK